jgi:RNA polymerase sigma-70 factor (ECF subfamily)
MARPGQDAAGTEESDDRLLIEAAQRDPSRFADLYERNFERVYAYIARRVHDRGDAQDLTSEVFHQALANLQGFEWRGAPFAAWLFRIAANAIADHSGRLARETSFPGTDEPQAPAVAEVEPSARLFRWVSRLPEDQRRVITMRFAEEKSIREIAGALGRTEGAVKQLQLRALQNLRTRMGKARG